MLGLLGGKIHLQSNKVIILGCGRQGARLAELLEAEQYEVAVIDRTASSFSRLHHFRGEKFVGNGVDEEILRRAGIKQAVAFAAVTNGDNTNLMTAQIARVIFEVPRVICRVYDPERASLYHDLGLETVSATTVGARMLRNMIIAPKILRQYQIGDGTAVALEFKLSSFTDGMSVEQLEIPGEFRIACIVRDQVPLVPPADYSAREGDHIFGAVMARSMALVKEKLQISELAVNFPSRGGV
ncbi:MAG: TrkA family potassium uptake protein [Armatimonadetes bacterium]|nr:TrkA family potassium uptake protein [Armatimonadota bacterium]